MLLAMRTKTDVLLETEELILQMLEYNHHWFGVFGGVRMWLMYVLFFMTLQNRIIWALRGPFGNVYKAKLNNMAQVKTGAVINTHPTQLGASRRSCSPEPTIGSHLASGICRAAFLSLMRTTGRRPTGFCTSASPMSIPSFRHSNSGSSI